MNVFSMGYEDGETANVISDAGYDKKIKKGGKNSEFTCLLLLQNSSGVVRNEEVIKFSVVYNPAITGNFEERLVIEWPSSVPTLYERTVRTKAQFLQESASVGQSDELVVVPGARGIQGFFRPSVVVKRTDGSRVCKAQTDGLIEVVNP